MNVLCRPNKDFFIKLPLEKGTIELSLQNPFTIVTKGDIHTEKMHYLMGGTSTLIFLGIQRLACVVEELIKYQQELQTPISLITISDDLKMKTSTGTIKTLQDLVKKNSVYSFDLLIVGEHCNNMEYRKHTALRGKNILLTSPEEESSALIKKLTSSGAEVIKFPTVAFQRMRDFTKLDEAIKNIEHYDWIIFSNVTSITYFLVRFFVVHEGLDKLKEKKLAARGPLIATALIEMGLSVDFFPADYHNDQFISSFQKKNILEKKVLIIGTKEDPHQDIFVEKMKNIGADITTTSAFEVVMPDMTEKKVEILSTIEQLDMMIFTSCYEVKNFSLLCHRFHIPIEYLKNITIVALAAETAKEAKQNGLPVNLIPINSTIEGLMEALLDFDYGIGA